MLRELIRPLLAACLVLLSACSLPAPSAKVEQGAREAFALLRAGDAEAIRKVSTRDLASGLKPENVTQSAAMLPKGDPESSRRIGYSENHFYPEGNVIYALTYEYVWPGQVALVSVELHQFANDPGLYINGVTFNIATPEALKANDFSLIGKPPLHYAMLLALLLTIGLMIAAVVMSVRTPGLRRRWLWILASLAAISQVGLNWTTGLVKFVLLHGALIGIGISKDDTQFAPWVLKVSIPIGAIIVIFRLWRRSRKIEDKAAQDVSST